MNQKNFIIFLVILVCFLFTSCNEIFNRLFGGSSSKTQAQSSIPPMNVTPKELFDAYKNNKVAADLKYKDKMIIITGRIQNFGTQTFASDNPVIYFSDGSLWGNSLAMFFNKSWANRIAELRIGDTITVEGKFTGFFITNLQMNNCRLIIERISSNEPSYGHSSPTTQSPSIIQFPSELRGIWKREEASIYTSITFQI